VGASLGNADLTRPLEGLTISHKAPSSTFVDTDIRTVNNLTDVQKAIKKSDKIVLLDFYADWCVACKLMNKHTFTDPKVKELLDQFTVIKANVTHNNVAEKALLQHYNVIAPPTFVFIGKDGEELSHHRIVGEMSANEFAAHLESILDAAS
ncbi:MAG: thioredoxin fold domain-containing protein, partial [Coxiellaceae bacterium]|nr:thioredoxin fold domain-containing protein [Coxiellaceae bacterium]